MPYRSSTGSFIKWYPQNASLNDHSEEVTPGCWPSRAEWQRKSQIWDWPIKGKEHRHWTEEVSKKVLWTDKSKFEVFGSRRRTFVRHRTSEKMLEECLTPSVKHVEGNVMVWGCVGAGKLEDLYKVKGILNKELLRCVFGFGFSLVCYVYSCRISFCFEPHYLLVVCTRDPLLRQCVYVLFSNSLPLRDPHVFDCFRV